MKQDIYKNRYVIAIMIVSALGVLGSIDLSFKIAFFVLNVLSAIILVNRIRKS